MSNTYALIKNSTVANIIIADAEHAQQISAEWDAVLQITDDTIAGIGWQYIDGAFVAPELPQATAAPIPAVTRRQALLALYRQHGITESDIFTAIEAIEDEGQRYEARIDFTGALSFERDNPLIHQMVNALGIADVDALFIYAATL